MENESEYLTRVLITTLNKNGGMEKFLRYHFSDFVRCRDEHHFRWPDGEYTGRFMDGIFLTEPGTYHLVITGVSDQPTKRDGTLFDNAMFLVNLTVIAGTTSHMEDKRIDIVFFHPDTNSKDDGKLAKEKIDRFFFAAGLATRKQLEKVKPMSMSIELEDYIGRQIIAKFDMDDRGDKPRLQLEFAEIYHVDDPAMKDVPKSEKALKLIDPSLRWSEGNGTGR